MSRGIRTFLTVMILYLKKRLHKCKKKNNGWTAKTSGSYILIKNCWVCRVEISWSRALLILDFLGPIQIPMLRSKTLPISIFPPVFSNTQKIYINAHFLHRSLKCGYQTLVTKLLVCMSWRQHILSSKWLHSTQTLNFTGDLMIINYCTVINWTLYIQTDHWEICEGQNLRKSYSGGVNVAPGPSFQLTKQWGIPHLERAYLYTVNLLFLHSVHLLFSI